MALIEVEKLSKEFRVFQRREGLLGAVADLFRREYRTLRAVDEVSFQIEAGEQVGYIGANGAGKSTTVKMLTGILTPTAGRVEVGGLVPHLDREQYVRNIGVVFGQRSQLWWDLAVIESFRLLAKIYGVSKARYEQHMARFDEVLGLSEFLHTPVRKLSLGQKMRCELAAALLHGPQVLFLDEPTIGLDVVAKQAIREFLKQINREHGTTMLLTTHDLGDIEELCERVLIIHKGRLLFDGPLAELRARLGGRVLLNFTLSRPADADRLTAIEMPGVEWANGSVGVVTAVFRRDEVSRAEVIRRALAEVEVDDVAMEEMAIESIVQTIFHEGRA
jgi:ABC-2 type transport system ATP-binding protein